MTLTPGTRLGPYEIQTAIGAGGMGEVYQAKDTRLDRSVAIKVLPAHVSADPDRRARFAREAKTIAGLTHPHICTLYDVGEHDGATFLVMEHLTGETLAQRLEKGPLPLEQALTVATEIADALTAAHRQGVIHRDLKPANVMLTKAGAKLLDFGLAKLKGHGEQPAAASLASAPTRTAPLTSEGTIIGTLQYMAPEQVEGKAADARTDLWALGAILYEMLTGKRAFEGTSAASLIGHIMNGEPPALATLQPLTPSALDRLVRQCLAKSPDDRPDTAHDVANDLRWLWETSGIGALPAVQPRRRRFLRTALTVASLVVAVAVGAGLMWLLRSPVSPPALRSARFEVLVPASDKFSGASGLAVAPDGSRIAYVAVRNGVRQLFLRSIDALEPQAIDGTDNAEAPFFSPDGQSVGFFAASALKKVRLGGAAVTVCEAGYRYGASWADDDVIVFASSSYRGLMRVSASGGAPAPLTSPGAKEFLHLWPEALAGRRAVIFTIAPAQWAPERLQLAVLDEDSGRQHLLLDGSYPHFVPPGYLTFVRDRALWVVGFDLRRLTLVGEPVRAAEIVQAYIGGFAEYAIGRAGTLVFRPPTDEGGELTWVDREGHAMRIHERTGFDEAALSPERRRIAAAQGANLCVYDLDRGTFTPVASGRQDSELVGLPAWSPDGTRIMFSQGGALYTVPADGSGPPVRLSPSNTSQYDASWLGDGATRVYVEHPREAAAGIWIQPPTGPAVPIRQTPGHASTMPAFSPDGRWLAYTEDGALYVQPYPTGERVRVSTTNTVSGLRWAPDGRELFYVSDGGEMVSVPVDPKSSSVFGRPRALFSAVAFSGDFDVDREGRFLMTTRREGRRLVVTLNWFEELRGKLPTIR